MSKSKDPKTKAANIENRIIGQMQGRERRKMMHLHMPVADVRHLVRSITSRAVWLHRRCEKDPLIHAINQQEALRCARIAQMLTQAMQEGSL
jgi:hypothetical protein